ncbi:hypothetical protein Dimus_003680 [Dionaea muscipula]
MVTIYVGNIPHMMERDWLRQIFQKFGNVRDIFIPRKRAKRTNVRFGFVKFKSYKEARTTIQEMHLVQVNQHQLIVKFAAFERRNNRFRAKRGENDEVQKNMRWVPVTRGVEKEQTGGKAKVTNQRRGVLGVKRPEHKSFAAIVREEGVDHGSTPMIRGESLGNGWLYRSVVATFNNYRSSSYLYESFVKEEGSNVDIKRMDNKQILITFGSTLQMNLIQPWIIRKNGWPSVGEEQVVSIGNSCEGCRCYCHNEAMEMEDEEVHPHGIIESGKRNDALPEDLGIEKPIDGHKHDDGRGFVVDRACIEETECESRVQESPLGLVEGNGIITARLQDDINEREDLDIVKYVGPKNLMAQEPLQITGTAGRNSVGLLKGSQDQEVSVRTLGRTKGLLEVGHFHSH